MARQIVGAHPRLGELIAEEVLKRGLLRNALPLDNGFEIGPVNYLEKDGSPKKPKKDPNAPKLRNAYVLYSTSIRAQIREENPDLSFGDVAKEISSRYKAFDADEMAKWQSKADAAKEVYKKEMAEYEKTRPKEKTAEKSSAKKKNGGSDNDGTTIKLSQQVTIGDSRVDYKMELIDNNNGSSHNVIFEVKNVVCADFEAGTEPTEKVGNYDPQTYVVVAPPNKRGKGKGKGRQYTRTALFPIGGGANQEFDGKPVISERACKHLRNLQSMLEEDDVTPVVLFIVNRSDCEKVRPCREKCPVFAKVFREAINAGVKALAVRVRWTEEGECFFDGVLPVEVDK